MANIPNPLGNLGTAPAILPDMTAGIQALQRAEIQQRLKDINQKKEWEREDKVRDEKAFLELIATPLTEDLRIDVAKKASAEANALKENMANTYRQAFSEGRPLTMDERIQQQKAMADIARMSQNASAFIELVDGYKDQAMKTYMDLRPGRQRDRFLAQQAEFTEKLKTKGISADIGTMDVAKAFSPGDLDPAAIMAEWDDMLIDNVKNATRNIDGKEVFDKGMFMDSVKATVSADPERMEIIKDEFGYTTDEQVYEHEAKRIRPSIDIKAGTSGSGSGAGAKDKPYEFVPSDNIVTRKGVRKSGVNVTNWAKPMEFVDTTADKDKDGNYPIVDFTPVHVVPDDDGKGMKAVGKINVSAFEDVDLPIGVVALNSKIGVSSSKGVPIAFDEDTGQPTTYRFKFDKDMELDYEVDYDRVKAEMETKLGSEFADVVKSTKSTKEADRPALSIAKYNEAKGTSYTRAQLEAAFGDQYKITE